MTLLTSKRLRDPDRPYQREFEDSALRRADRGRMPKTLPQLLRWMSEQWVLETPAAIQVVEEVWSGKQEYHRDGSTRWPAELTGGSHLGTPREVGAFRHLMEGSPQAIDEDGSYIRPLRAALARLSWRRPLMARNLVAVMASGCDWRGVAARGGWAEEMYADYLTAALVTLWREYKEERMH